jgi:predicted AAA+ superfamily ATPase
MIPRVPYEFRRREFVEEVHGRLEVEPLLLVTGPRGAGKTHTLREIHSGWRGPGSSRLLQIEPIACSPEILDRELLRLAGGILDESRREPSFDAVLEKLRRREKSSLLLLDDVTEIRTLSYYPSVTEPLENFLDALKGGGKVIATSRFSYWMERQFPGLPALRLPPLSASDLADAGVRDAEGVSRATAGLAGHAVRLAETLELERGSVEDALERELSPGGRIEAECRATLSELLHRARGYGACKSVLRVLAEEENRKLTEVARELDRTAGSTRDYLRWLEEVDLIVVKEKRFSFVDPLLRLWMRIYARGAPPTRSDLETEIRGYLGEEPTATEPDFTLPPPARNDFVEID